MDRTAAVPLSLHEAENEFMRLLDRIEPRQIATFLDWVTDSFSVTDAKHPPPSNASKNVCAWKSAEVEQANAMLKKIALEIRGELPDNAIVESEVQYWPTVGLDSDCDPNTTVHVDAFLYDDDDVDELVDEGRLSRNYCTECGSKQVKPLTFISHSLSVDQLRFMFTMLVPLNEAMSNRLIVDVGSRLGAVLYASYLYSGARINAIGIEMNKEFCALQQKTIEDNDMSDRVKVINDDVRNQAQVIASGDVIVLNNVFNFFLPPEQQLSCWSFLYENTRGGAVIISHPNLEAVTEHLSLPFAIDEWLDKIETSHLAARFAGTDDELFEDCDKIKLYSVRHRKRTTP